MAAVTFLAPGWLWLALVVPLVWFLPRPIKDRVHGALRSLVLLAVVAALAFPAMFTTTDDVWRVVILDAQGSVADVDAREAESYARILGTQGADEGPTVLVSLGAEAPPSSVSESFDRSVRVHDPRSPSSLARALEAAARAIPHGARGSITILSDGLATDRRWGPVAQSLQRRGIHVHAAQLATAPDAARIVDIEVPDIVRVGHTARLRVYLDDPRDGPIDAVDVQLVDASGSELARAERAQQSEDAAVVLAWEPKAAGVHAVEVRVRPSGAAFSASRSNHRTLQIAVQEPLAVLYLGERMVEGGPQLASLLGSGFAFDAPAAGEAVDAARLAAADLVVVDDRPAPGVSEDLQRRIVEAVTQGEVGLVMAGGRASFGAGGWHRAPLANVLPIEMIQKEEKRDPSTALVLIIDTSGSMGGNRVQLAKEVARLAIRRLLPHDKVGIVEFYGAKRWAAPIQPASNAIEIQRALNRLNAGGGTVIMPAIEEAFYGLQNVRTRYKHVLVLTDGGVETGAFEPLVRRMADKGITVSTVLVGPGMHSEFLVSIANWGKGRFYGVPNRFNLPEVILKQPASAHLPPWRPGQHALRAGSAAGWWEGMDREAVPPLSGYIEARARSGAEVLLEVAATKHPILASWRYGLGRATALLTEPTGPGTAGWQDWPDYGTFLARVLARTASDTHAPYACRAEREDDTVRVTARALRSASDPRFEVRDEPGGAWRAVSARQRAPGLFEARLPAAAGSALRVVTETPASLTYVAVESDVVPEHQVQIDKGLDIGGLASATGGSFTNGVKQASYDLSAGGGAAPIAVVPLWPWCLLLALLLYLVELAWRRRPSGGTR